MLLYLSLCALPFTSALVLPPTHLEEEIPNEGHVESRILYGDHANIRDYPFYAGLPGCGAVILSPVWVLTVAHCIHGPHYGGPVMVGSGTKKRSQRFEIRKVFYPRNKKNVMEDDIALIKLKKKLTFSDKVQPVRLPHPQALKAVEGQGYEFIGRGTDETGEMAFHLQKSKMQVFTFVECLKKYQVQLYHDFVNYFTRKLDERNKKLICTIRDNKLSGICSGDSGSPLVQGNVLIGLGAHVYDSLSADPPDSYLINVEYYLPWIKNITGFKF